MGLSWEERARLERAAFRHRFATPEQVRAFVEQVGRRADERLPELYQRREVQRANVDTLRLVGGDPYWRAQEALGETSTEIEYLEPWQQVRDCLAADLVSVEITSRYVHFASRYPKCRLCHFGPGNTRLEFTMGGEQALATLARAARALRRTRHA